MLVRKEEGMRPWTIVSAIAGGVGTLLIAVQFVPMAAASGAPQWRPFVERASFTVEDRTRYGRPIVQRRFLGILPLVECSIINGVDAAKERCRQPIKWPDRPA